MNCTPDIANRNNNSNIEHDTYLVRDDEKAEDSLSCTENEDVAADTEDTFNDKKRDYIRMSDNHRRQRRLESNRRSAAESRKRKRLMTEALQTSMATITQENTAVRQENKLLHTAMTNLSYEIASLRQKNEYLHRSMLMGNAVSYLPHHQANIQTVRNRKVENTSFLSFLPGALLNKENASVATGTPPRAMQFINDNLFQSPISASQSTHSTLTLIEKKIASLLQQSRAIHGNAINQYASAENNPVNQCPPDSI